MSDENTVENQLERAIEILEPMIESGADEDDMGIELVRSGFKFAKAGRLVTQVLQAKGLKLSPKARFEQVEEHLVSWNFQPESWDDVLSTADALSQEIDATTTSQAVAAIKKFAKQNGIEMPSKPKKSSGSTRTNVFDKFYVWALENKDADSDLVMRWVGDLEVSEKQSAKYCQRLGGILEFARKFQS